LAQSALDEGKKVCVDDREFFDRINHDILMDRMARRR
jgi:hypothetical protein